VTPKPRFELPTAPLPLVVAIGIAVALSLPLQLFTKPYDDAVLGYWTAYGIPVVFVAILAGTLRIPMLAEFPSRAARLLLAPKPWVFALGVAVATLALTLWFQHNSFERAASTSDEFAMLWHAKMLSRGFLALQGDVNPEFFAIDNVIDEGNWYSHFPIGGPLALVPGVLIGAPWIMNPLFAAMSVPCVYRFAQIAFGELQGRAAAAVFVFTPGILFMSATYMNHVPTLFLATVVMVSLAEWERALTPIRRHTAIATAGLALGLMATIRPLDAVIVAAVVGAFELYVIRKTPRRLAEVATQVVAGLVGVLPLLYVNDLTNGGPFTFGYDVSWGEGHRIGFHADPRGETHDFARGVLYASRYVSELNFSLMAWPIPLMAIIMVGLIAMRRTSRWDALILGLICAQVAGYAAYWGLGEFLGPRFLFTALPAVVILVARTPFVVAERVGGVSRRIGVALILSCLLVAWLAPGEVGNVRGQAKQIVGLRRVFRVDIAGAVREAGIHNALVFIREPMTGRLMRRLWGVGVPRELATSLLRQRDACTLLRAVVLAERTGTLSREARVRMVVDSSMPMPDSGGRVMTRDPQIQIASMETLTEPCKRELDGNDYAPASFGTALVLEDFDEKGRLAGDIIYAADLTDHNEVLRERFKDRTWYRLQVTETANRVVTAKIVSY
jgi:hypothetical protein